MRIRVNGSDRELVPGTTVEELVRELAAAPERGVAVALDGDVIPRSAWGGTRIADGQEVEVLRAVQGG